MGELGDVTLLEQQYQNKPKFNVKKLRLSLKYRPRLFRLILKLRACLRKKSIIIKNLKKQLQSKQNEKSNSPAEITEVTTDEQDNVKDFKTNTEWNVQDGNNEKTLADQVKEAAQNALDQTGMVYVESAGMYYDYKTGYYYNSELGLYYHTNTNCYYYYSSENKSFVFHSYPDTSKISSQQKALSLHHKKQAKKLKKVGHNMEDIDTLARALARDIEDKKGSLKRRKNQDKKDKKKEAKNSGNKKGKLAKSVKEDDNDNPENGLQEMQTEDADNEKNCETNAHLEDGECSDSSSSDSSENEQPNTDASTSTASEEDDSIAKHHPPCMRVIVKETKLPKLKVGSLFLVTKDGGTIGREGEQHTILLGDLNVSRTHLDLKYDITLKCYIAIDLGSKNGTVLNGHRMSESQVVSSAMAIRHGSVIQLGETKLLCHIHSGNDTCGHCEPGLVMEADSTEKQVAYTRTCSVQKQYQLELARLKNKFAPEPLAIEDGAYVDRAKARREAVGSTHEAEKTQQTDLETNIASDNKGFQMLEKMGWSKGEGLGKDNQGSTEPVPLINNESKAGLGAAGSAAPVSLPIAGRPPLRLATKIRSLSLRPPAKAFRDPLEEDDD